MLNCLHTSAQACGRYCLCMTTCVFFRDWCVCVCVCFCEHIVHVSMCICVRVLLHIVTYACVFSLWDASVTGAELIVADGWRQEQTYILLCHTEEEEEEGDKNWGLFCAPLPPLSPLLIYLPCFSLPSPLHSLHFFSFCLVWHLTVIWSYSAHWEEVIEEGIEAKEGHEIKGTTSAEGSRKKTSRHRFVFQYIRITRRDTML